MITETALFRTWQMMIAIASFEGFFIPGSRAERNNNPGNLRGWDPANAKDDKGFDIFPDFQSGLFALWQQIWLNIFRDLTLKEFFIGKPGVYPGYAPLSDGNSLNYPRFVSRISGIPLDNVTIKSYLSLDV